MDKLSYALGIGIGSQLRELGGLELVAEDFAQAVKDVIEDKELAVSNEEAQELVNNFFQEAEKKKQAKMKEAEKLFKADGEKFLTENAKKEGVTVLPSGLQYLMLSEGTGKQPKASDSVKCHYEGRLIDGTVFDSSYKRNSPATFPLSGVIKGWTEGLQHVKEGGKVRLFIPYDLAYGTQGAGSSIPPYAALIFDVELIEIV